jgi:hypothetical protein
MRYRRLAALVVGAMLISGGAVGLTNHNGPLVTVIGAGLSIVAGLAFLSISARARS